MNINELCAELHEQAQELIQSGNSREQAEGYGMQRVIDAIYDLQTVSKLKSEPKNEEQPPRIKF